MFLPCSNYLKIKIVAQVISIVLVMLDAITTLFKVMQKVTSLLMVHHQDSKNTSLLKISFILKSKLCTFQCQMSSFQIFKLGQNKKSIGLTIIRFVCDNRLDHSKRIVVRVANFLQFHYISNLNFDARTGAVIFF